MPSGVGPLSDERVLRLEQDVQDLTREVTDRMARMETRLEGMQRSMDAMPATIGAAVSSAVTASLQARGAPSGNGGGDVVARALDLAKDGLKIAGWVIAGIFALKK